MELGTSGGIHDSDNIYVKGGNARMIDVDGWYIPIPPSQWMHLEGVGDLTCDYTHNDM